MDRSVLSAAEMSVVAGARARQVAHEQALLLADVVELGRIPWDGPGEITRQQADEYSADQVCFAVTMSRWAADKMLGLGMYLLDTLPMVYEALLTGRIDYPRAMVYKATLEMLDDETARRIAAETLARAQTWTPGQLRERLHYRATKADPSLAKRRLQRSVADRSFHIDIDGEGTASMVGRNLPPDRAVAAKDRLDRIAKAAKAEGDPRTMDQLRADAAVDSLAGFPFVSRPNRDEFTAEADRQDAAERAAVDGPGASVSDEAAAQPETRDGAGARIEAGMLVAPGMVLCGCGGVRLAGQRGVVDILVPMSTLIGHTENPGLIPGWGPVIADVARQVAFDQEANPIWKWSLTDDAGQLLHHGYTQRRPIAAEESFVRSRDVTCRWPGCRRAAKRCDLDHNQDHATLGPSHRGNICSLCTRHHRVKTRKRLRIHRVALASTLWEAPDGRLCLVRGDGNIVAIAEADEHGNYDLEHGIPAQQVHRILPV